MVFVQFVEKARDELLALLPGAMFFQQQLTELLFESVNQLQSRMASQIRSQPSWLFTGEVVPVAAHQQ